MSATDYPDPFASDVGPFDEPVFPLTTAQPAPRPAPVPLRTRAADLADEALRSPRWDQVRGLVFLASLTVVGAALALLFAVTFLMGAVVLVRMMWEAVG